MKVEKGVMVMKDGKAWGIVDSDGKSTSYGWIEVEDAPIHDPKYCKKPEDITWSGDLYNIRELQKGSIIKVERHTNVVIID